MLDEDLPYPRRTVSQVAGTGQALRNELSTIGIPRDRTAHSRVHPPGPRQEVAERRVQGRGAVDQPAQRRLLDRLVVRALAHLGQLLRITQQQQIAGGRRDGDGVGQAELAGLLDDQQIKASRRHPDWVGENPCGAADHATAVLGEEVGVLLVLERLPRRDSPLLDLLADPLRIGSCRNDFVQQVLHHAMRLRDDTHPPAMAVDQRGDHPGRGVGFPASGRAVDGQIGPVQFPDRGGEIGDVVAGPRQRPTGVSARWPPGEDVDISRSGQLR